MVGLAYTFYTRLNYFFKYLEDSGEGDTAPAFTEFVFDTVIHGSDCNLGFQQETFVVIKQFNAYISLNTLPSIFLLSHFYSHTDPENVGIDLLWVKKFRLSVVKFLAKGHAGKKSQNVNLSPDLILNSTFFAAVLNIDTNNNKNCVVLFVKQIPKLNNFFNFIIELKIIKYMLIVQVFFFKLLSML